MRAILRKFFKNQSARLLAVIIIIMVVFNYASGRFIFVQAFANQVNIFPGHFEASPGADRLLPAWEGAANIMFQDLPPQADFSEFNRENSAYFMLNWPSAGLDIEPAVQSDEEEIIPAEETSDSPAIKGVEQEFPAAEEPLPADTSSIVIEQAPTPEENSFSPPESFSDDNHDIPEDISQEPAEAPAAVEQAPGGEAGETSYSPIRRGNFFFLPLKQFFRQIFQPFSARADETAEESGSDSASMTVPNPSALVFSDFGLPLAPEENQIGNIDLLLSLGATSDYPSDRLLLEYNNNGVWQEFGQLAIKGNISNAAAGDYFRFNLPVAADWENVQKLAVRLSYQNDDYVPGAGQPAAVFLDALWLEINYAAPELAEEEKSDEEAGKEDDGLDETALFRYDETASREKGELELLTPATDFQIKDAPEFNFRFRKKRNLLQSVGAGLLSLFRDEYAGLSVSVHLLRAGEEVAFSEPIRGQYDEDGRFSVRLPDLKNHLPAGRYTLKILLENSGEAYSYSQDFNWGVLALNFNKTVYHPDEEAFLQMAVLDDLGKTLCLAEALELTITAPDGQVSVLSLSDGTITANLLCGPDNVINEPDFYAYYQTGSTGEYQVKLRALTINGEREVADSFLVSEEIEFDLERIGPTRIYPPADYEMKIRIKATEDFEGLIIEQVPLEFSIFNFQFSNNIQYPISNIKIISDGQSKKIIIDDISLNKNEIYWFSYSFDAPDISPEFYLFGPARVGDFVETRQWQIAADATSVYSATGSYTFTVPYGVTSITAKLWGAGGGGGGGGRRGGRV
ncbi:hypothetical protein COX69_03880, partial [Candidatus Falkowbacteria bacterium CG_4_10_14_0_2_um_filter_48_10]